MSKTKNESASATASGAHELPPLSAEFRRAVCVHEAGHAVMHALGGAWVHGVRVAPLGATTWRTRGRKGGMVSDAWGLCLVSDPPCALALRWDEIDGLSVDRKFWRRLVAMLEAEVRGSRAEQQRQVRAWIVGTMGGPMAEARHTGKAWEASADGWTAAPTDGNMIEVMGWLLPHRDELEHLQALTAAALELPEVWACVLRIADALEARGTLSERQVYRLLPEAVSAWPPSMRMRKPAPLAMKLRPSASTRRPAAAAARGPSA
jgi:hypothetical protein